LKSLENLEEGKS